MGGGGEQGDHRVGGLLDQSIRTSIGCPAGVLASSSTGTAAITRAPSGAWAGLAVDLLVTVTATRGRRRLDYDPAGDPGCWYSIQGLEARRAFVVPRGARNSSDTRSFDPQVLTGGSPLPRVPMRPSRGVVLEFEEGVTAVEFGSTR